ncbi:MAG: prephenate dehydratase [Epsilonproteobacteria bacterium]|nr:prephenate dehydratase [Campylobacterota bacterium]NPA88833.1 prephenate dehydratase [Campylobacterota bacterium]
MKDLESLRREIDKIDAQILELLWKRFQVVKEVGEFKNRTKSPIFLPDREKRLIARLTSLAQEKGWDLTQEEIKAIYSEIIAVSRNRERRERVAYLGPQGSYTHQGAVQKFGSLTRYLPLTSIEAVFKAVESGEAKYGVVPIENNTHGQVGLTLDGLRKYDVKIVGEICTDIHHSFASVQDEVEKIERIYSHPQAYHQCIGFLESHGLLDREFIPVDSTSAAAKKAVEDPKSGAICSKIAAKLYNLPLLFEKIEDNKANRTRFVILSNYFPPASGEDKTSVIATTYNRPGALVELLQRFKELEINLLKIESRPLKDDTFENVSFYLEFEGHISDPKISQLVEGEQMKILGSYPREC